MHEVVRAVQDAKWNPTDPQLRFRSLPLGKKVEKSLEVFTESVLRPMIKQKIDNKQNLLNVLSMRQCSIDGASGSDDDALDDMLEQVLARIKRYRCVGVS